MKYKIGDKLVSDDYCAIGVLTEVGDKIMVVGDFGSVEYEEYCADWELYDDWFAKVKEKRNQRGGILRHLWNMFN